MCHATLVNEFILEIRRNSSIANNGMYYYLYMHYS